MGFTLFGWNILSSKEMLEASQTDARPLRGWGPSDSTNLQLQFDNVFMAALYDYAYYSDTYRTIINAITREIFRNGGKWEPVFVKKCISQNCGLEFDSEIEKCSNCGSTTRDPDTTQKLRGEAIFKQVNANEQSYMDLLKTFQPDCEVLDNLYLIFLKRYHYNQSGEIISADFLEMVRGDPLYMRKIIDRYGRPGRDLHTQKPLYVCPEHRNKPVNVAGKCPEKGCGKIVYPAFFKSIGEDTKYYLAGEVCHATKYTKTIYYGFPMGLTVLMKIKSLLAMDNYIFQYYNGQKTPKTLPLIKTSNVPSAKAAWTDWLDNVNKNPHAIWPMFVPTSATPNSQDLFQLIDFTRTLEEMQYMEGRREMITRIGAIFGVMPIFSGDIKDSGGMNNEGMQITVTSRSYEESQGVYNDKVTPFVLKQLGITDWKHTLNPPEERDEMAEVQLELAKDQHAQNLKGLGFEVARKPDGEFKFSEKATAPPPAQTPTDQIDPAFLTRADGSPSPMAKSANSDPVEQLVEGFIDSLSKQVQKEGKK